MTVNRRLSVTGDLILDVGDDSISIRAAGSTVIVEVPRFLVAFQMLWNAGSFRRARKRLAGLASFFTHLGLTVVVRTPTRKLLTIGGDEDSRLLRHLSVPNVRFHLL